MFGLFDTPHQTDLSAMCGLELCGFPDAVKHDRDIVQLVIDVRTPSLGLAPLAVLRDWLEERGDHDRVEALILLTTLLSRVAATGTLSASDPLPVPRDSAEALLCGPDPKIYHLLGPLLGPRVFDLVAPLTGHHLTQLPDEYFPASKLMGTFWVSECGTYIRQNTFSAHVGKRAPTANSSIVRYFTAFAPNVGTLFLVPRPGFASHAGESVQIGDPYHNEQMAPLDRQDHIHIPLWSPYNTHRVYPATGRIYESGAGDEIDEICSEIVRVTGKHPRLFVAFYHDFCIYLPNSDTFLQYMRSVSTATPRARWSICRTSILKYRYPPFEALNLSHILPHSLMLTSERGSENVGLTCPAILERLPDYLPSDYVESLP